MTSAPEMSLLEIESTLESEDEEDEDDVEETEERRRRVGALSSPR